MQPRSAHVAQVETSLFRSAWAYSGFRSPAIRPTQRQTSRASSSSLASPSCSAANGAGGFVIAAGGENSRPSPPYKER